ncbi:hypothetical protein J1N35_001070 [Gossypium stocksii]|uniref:Uncharacterized protein n=1 Tax=Gossypium stocksii TaxID=47602 RepID=A0A9D4AKQ0_9ROSI|nr:hypothetical protein J1N35_001070 [Gossypium stocksii]
MSVVILHISLFHDIISIISKLLVSNTTLSFGMYLSNIFVKLNINVFIDTSVRITSSIGLQQGGKNDPEQQHEAPPPMTQGGLADALALDPPLSPLTLALSSAINGVSDGVKTFSRHFNARLYDLSRQVDIHFIGIEEQMVMLLSRFCSPPPLPSNM